MSKRIFDICLSLVIAILCFPLILLLVLLVLIISGSPVFFSQERIGFKSKPFLLYKFRTMDANKNVSNFSHFLRVNGLDELPQLWLIFIGKMSFVGPRPLLPEYLQIYTPEQATRHSVKPGLTGWAQINGRNQTTWEERLKADIWYVKHQSFMLDMRIIGRTLRYMVSRKKPSDFKKMPRLNSDTFQ